MIVVRGKGSTFGKSSKTIEIYNDWLNDENQSELHEGVINLLKQASNY